MSDEQDGGKEVGPEGLTVLEAAGLMEGMIDDTGMLLEEQEPEESVVEDEAEEAEDDAPEDESDVDDLEEIEDVDDPEDEGEEDEDSEETSDDAPQNFKVPAAEGDGFEEITREEYEARQLRQADYTRKTQELAEQRRAVAAEFEAVRAERQNYAQGLETLEQIMEAFQPAEMTVEEIKAATPEELKAHEQRKQQLEQVKAERERAQREAEAEYQAQRQKTVAEESERLLEVLDLTHVDQEARVERLMQLVNYARDNYGYTQDDFEAVVDHRPLVLLDKARRYDEMVEKGEEVRTKAKKAPVLKPGSTSVKKSSEKKRKEAARSRLSKEGSLAAAAKVFEDFIE